MAKKPKPEMKTDAWMGTYSDMVTLLMCFFILLFSMSTLDATKWKILVQGFNPDAESQSQIILDQDTEPTESTTAIDSGGETLLSEDAGKSLSTGQTSSETQSENPTDSSAAAAANVSDLSSMNEFLEQYITDNNLEDQIKLYQGDDYTYIMFSNNIFFDGDSSVLKSDGKAILDVFGQAMAQVSNQIYKLQVVGHTNQSDPEKPNNIETDRYLSSNRAVEVLIYLQKMNILEGKKLESVGYGQHYPIGSFTTVEGRASNRRVELLLSETPSSSLNLDSIYGDIAKAQASGEITNNIVDASVVTSN